MHKILFYNKFIICLYMFRALCAHQEVKIVLYSIWYHHTCIGGRPVNWLRGLLVGMTHSNQSSLNLCTGWLPTGLMIPDAV